MLEIGKAMGYVSVMDMIKLEEEAKAKVNNN